MFQGLMGLQQAPRGSLTFSEGGIQLLTPMETSDITCDFPGWFGPSVSHPLDPRMLDNRCAYM